MKVESMIMRLYVNMIVKPGETDFTFANWIITM